jgi:exonuclease SbcD
MLTHQAAYVDHLLEVVSAERIDLVVVSGDIYDRALPPVDAVRLADESLVRLAASPTKVVLTSGNHDSAQRLGFSSRLIDAAGVFIRTDASSVDRPIELEDAHGPVAIYGVPYLDPHAVAEPWSLPDRSHHAALGEAMRRVRADLSARPASTRSVVLAHAFVAGAEPSDSERDISVGGVARVPTDVFSGVDYAALGHLHGRHTLTDAIRYSGSPLAYSFSEAGHLKGSWLVELGAAGLVTAEFVEAPVPRPLARLRGSLESLLADPAHSKHESAWVEVTLTDALRPTQAMERLRQRFPHALMLSFDSGSTVSGLAPVVPTVTRTDHDIAADFMTDMRGAPPSHDETELLFRAIDACCEDTDVDMMISEEALF